MRLKQYGRHLAIKHWDWNNIADIWQLTHWCWNNMADIWQRAFTNTFSRENISFLFKFISSLFIMAPLTISQHWWEYKYQYIDTYVNARRNIQFHFCERFVGYWLILSPNAISESPNDNNSVFVQVMAWCQIYTKSLSHGMITQSTDAYIFNLIDSANYNCYDIDHRQSSCQLWSSPCNVMISLKYHPARHMLFSYLYSIVGHNRCQWLLYCIFALLWKLSDCLPN